MPVVASESTCRIKKGTPPDFNIEIKKEDTGLAQKPPFPRKVPSCVLTKDGTSTFSFNLTSCMSGFSFFYFVPCYRMINILTCKWRYLNTIIKNAPRKQYEEHQKTKQLKLFSKFCNNLIGNICSTGSHGCLNQRYGKTFFFSNFFN